MVMLALFALFTVLTFVMRSGYLTLFGAAYLLALLLALGLTIRLRRTIESV
jgi:hypothetical protein